MNVFSLAISPTIVNPIEEEMEVESSRARYCEESSVELSSKKCNSMKKKANVNVFDSISESPLDKLHEGQGNYCEMDSPSFL